MSILKDNIPIDCLLFPNSHYISTAPFIFHAFGILKLTQYEACFPDLFRSFAIQEKINLKKQTVIMMHEHPSHNSTSARNAAHRASWSITKNRNNVKTAASFTISTPVQPLSPVILNERQELLGMPEGKGTGQRYARPARRILGLFREQRGRSGTGSQRRNRTGSNPHGISVFPAQHLPVFRISGTHRRLFLPLYGGR